MAPVLMTLGLFVFQLESIPYQELSRRTAWRLPALDRVGQRAARQYLGPGEDQITLSAVLAPEITGGYTALDLLRTMAARGIAWPLIEGTGRILGRFSVESVEETGTLFFKDGAAQRIDFRMTLVREDAMSDLVPAIGGAAISLLM